MYDHNEYSMRFEDEEEEVYLDDGLDISNENSINTYMKHGDELLIDMVRSRPYLYDKMVQNYKDAEMKENAWTEIAAALNITSIECKNHWLRFRQRFSKERQLREQETRSGAEKPTRQKWMLFDSLTFLERHVTQRRSFSNVNFIKPSEPSGVSETSLKTQRSMIPQEDHKIFANNDSNTSTSTFSQQPQHTLISKEKCNTLSKISIHTNQPNLCFEPNRQSRSSSPLIRRMPPAAIKETLISSIPSSHQTFASDMEGSAMVSPSCFSGNQALKKRKIDSVETAFHQMNNTLSTMANEMCSRRTPVNDNDADILIGKLITTELQRAIEPHKNDLKQKIMELLYFSKP